VVNQQPEEGSDKNMIWDGTGEPRIW